MPTKTHLLIGGILAASCAFGQNAPRYSLTKAVTLGGDGGWDYLSVDSASHRLYISRGTHIMVIDTNTMRQIGDIPNTPGVHGAVVARKHGVGFTSNGRDNTVTEFDLKTLHAIRTIQVGQRPDAILYDPASDRVFTFNGGSSDATAIDAATGTVAGTVSLAGRPEFPQTDGNGKMFVNIEDKSEIQQIDPRALRTVNTWPIAPGEEPSGLAIDTHDHLLFSVCSNNKMTVLNYDNGQVVATPTIGNGPDAAGFDSKYGLAFSSNGQSGTLDVVGRNPSGQWSVLQTVPTRVSARTMALDPRTHKIYLVSAEFEPAPAPTNGERRRRAIKPGSFTVLVVEPRS